MQERDVSSGGNPCSDQRKYCETAALRLGERYHELLSVASPHHSAGLAAVLAASPHANLPVRPLVWEQLRAAVGWEG